MELDPFNLNTDDTNELIVPIVFKRPTKAPHTLSTTLALIFVSVLALSAIISLRHKHQEDTQAVVEKPITMGTHFDQFERLPIKAKAVYIYDINDRKVIYAKNEEAQLPLASLTKVMVAATITGIVPEYTIVTVPESKKVGDKALSGVPGLHSGDQLKLKDLIDYTLTISSNEGASLIASLGSSVSKEKGTLSEDSTSTLPFIEQMNVNAKKLGMNQTYFINESGLDENNKVSGAYGSAKDMGILFEYMLMFHSNILEATTFDDTAVPTVDKAKRTAINTNTLVGQTPRVLASKTGLTDLAGGNLVMAIDAGLAHPVIIAVLGSTQEGRFSDMKALIAQTEQTLNLEP